VNLILVLLRNVLGPELAHAFLAVGSGWSGPVGGRATFDGRQGLIKPQGSRTIMGEVQDCGHGRTRNACFEVGKYLILFWNQASEANVAGNAERDVI
jgi:hypothetical protein